MRIIFIAFLVAGCCQTKYITKTPDFNMPERPVIIVPQETDPVGVKERAIGINYINLGAYAKKLENVLETIKETK